MTQNLSYWIPTQLLLIPITLWSGIEQGFFGADFTAGFIREIHDHSGHSRV